MIRQAAAHTATAPTYPRFLDAGETALVVEFGETVDRSGALGDAPFCEGCQRSGYGYGVLQVNRLLAYLVP